MTAEEFWDYALRRPIYTCEGQFVNQYIWSGYYKERYMTTEKAMFFLVEITGKPAAFMPYCAVEDIPESFRTLEQYFAEEVKQPLKIYLADKVFVEELQKDPAFTEKYTVEADRDSYDYLYDAEKLRTLSGKKYHKKKNNLNSFMKEYAGRYEYRSLDCSNLDEIEAFHQHWLQDRQIIDPYNRIDAEEDGIYRVFRQCSMIDCKMGGIYLDGRLEAYSIGSYNPSLKMADIHIEKANPEIRGLYTIINQQFLINAFPEAELVNREDDMGEDGLRQAKESYQPIRMEEKFTITAK